MFIVVQTISLGVGYSYALNENCKNENVNNHEKFNVPMHSKSMPEIKSN